jgi:hypothetical protein
MQLLLLYFFELLGEMSVSKALPNPVILESVRFFDPIKVKSMDLLLSREWFFFIGK